MACFLASHHSACTRDYTVGGYSGKVLRLLLVITNSGLPPRLITKGPIPFAILEMHFEGTSTALEWQGTTASEAWHPSYTHGLQRWKHSLTLIQRYFYLVKMQVPRLFTCDEAPSRSHAPTCCHILISFTGVTAENSWNIERYYGRKTYNVSIFCY